jgi:hypothetical protein
MYIIRAKRRKDADPGWVVMKTPLGAMYIAFTALDDAQAYLMATGHDSHCEARPRDELLTAEPNALAGVTRLLLLPSLEAARSLIRDGAAFPYERFIVAIRDAV